MVRAKQSSKNPQPARRIDTLPKWAQIHIRALEERVSRAEATIPWTQPGMDWFTLFHPLRASPDRPESITVFTCDARGTHPICSLGPNDTLFVGRGKPYIQAQG